MAEQYTYAVARIRAKETSLLSMQDLEQVLSAKTEKEAALILADKGFDGNGTYTTPEALLTEETEKTKKLIEELIGDVSVFDVFLYPDDFHNLKAAIKTARGSERDGIFVSGGSVDVDIIKEAVSLRNFSLLPEMMRAAAEEALDVLMKTGDGQSADMIIDKACLTAIKNAGDKDSCEMIKNYAELTVALSDIKIAARGAVMKKSAEFIKRALAECETIDVEKISAAASEGEDALYEYLASTPYESAKDALKISFSEFEKWCDNIVMKEIKKQKSNPFTIAPVAAYYLAREIEIKAVRIVLSGVINKLNENSVRERLRDLYV